MELQILRGELNSNYPRAFSWLTSKVDRQRRVLDRLQEKGKGHTKEQREEIARGPS